MLVEQTAINFAANVFSAAFGLLNVIIFTRLFAPAEFGIYVLGAGFAAIVSTFLCSWLRLPIMREQARGDGTDVRGIILPGLFLSCLLAPFAFTGAVWSGTAIRFDGARLMRFAKSGMPLTLSLTLLAMSSVIDRFIIAHLVGPAGARHYNHGAD